MSKTVKHRPETAREVVFDANDFRDFGMSMRNWFHELRKIRSRGELAQAVAEEPDSMVPLFPEGNIADAYLAAQVEHLCRCNHVHCPEWAFGRVLDDPWFAHEWPELRTHLLVDSPAAFINHNVFTTPEIGFLDLEE